LGDEDRLDGVAVRLEQDDELVAAESRDRVLRPDSRGQAHGDDRQQLVADRVPERVVDALEAVEVEEQYPRRSPGPTRPGEAALDPVEEERPVREPCQ